MTSGNGANISGVKRRPVYSGGSSSTDSDSDSAPLAKRSQPTRLKRRLSSDSSSSDSDNAPLAKRSQMGRSKRKPMDDSDSSSSGSESDKPLSSKSKVPKIALPNGLVLPKTAVMVTALKHKSAKAYANSPPKKIKKEQSTKTTVKKESNMNQVRVKKEKGKPVGINSNASLASQLIDRKPLIKAESSLTAGSANGSEATSEADDEEHKWWLENKGDDGPKWQTLEHSGVLFPPEYVPHGVPLLYKNSEITLAPQVEEVATFFAAVLGTEHERNKVFQKNFFDDFKEVLDEHMPGHSVKEYKWCDFTRIRAHLDSQSAKRKAMTKHEKDAAKKEKMEIEEKYSTCMLDGRREKVGNFRIEPPSLFRGRGAHPKTGKLKKRVMPEQVTINIGAGAKVPDPPPGHRWGKVCNDNTVTWLAMWKENINGNTKYVFLAAGSSLKGQSDMRKFDKARNLVLEIDKIRKQYTKDLKSNIMADRQRATAMYLIDRYALRAGNEKSDDEADTVGCCSLRCEHITLEPPNIVHFDFLGKDSIRYQRTTDVDKQVWKNLKIFQKGEDKLNSDMLFDRLNTTLLNKHLQTLMPGLTAKVFRTFNASFVFQQQLRNTPTDGTEAEKILAYNRSNREVAVLCNHQRSVSKGFEGQMTRIEDKILAARYQRKLLKEYLLEIAPMLKKKRPDLAQRESGVTSKWIKAYLLTMCEQDREKLTKKFERDNEKLREAGEPQLPESQLKEKIAEIDAREKSIKDGSYVAEPPVAKNATTDKVLEKLDKLTERIKNIELDKIEKDENKTTALSTSKLNYIDPRISIAWCKKYNVPIEKIFNKTLREKFTWALEVDANWTF
ncbi:DNA topoisomerase 1 [Coemansia sp. RSA 1813]|nr:DNA topoisomerase 1 [Coemansia sp. RSA 1646]KAJ1773189.1 DNA topoisomerase 1 [Coemansia sp. RSA 1843]KAJ2092066.1 DNA topoisomerase 1 [Coemansia sp. RSA 986]KAJ2216598.1 DNA topoisomerase 1 [Coemansia sp. RSA 487]KAJ2572119.1 DNA topoisomerase 1 [Coemansia sp. RSA 1813]